jgi:uncharacterized protein (UPF0303 family)
MNADNLNRDIDLIAGQEAALVLSRFDAADAWRLGESLKRRAESKGQAVLIEIRIAGHTVFCYAMPGTAPANADWARRKRNTVELLQRSSYGVGLGLQREGSSLEAKMGLPTRDYASHGGGLPMVVRGVGCIGVVTVSGLPQREDHEMVVAALAELAGVAVTSLALP